jgi:aminomethyltransferase
MLKHTPLYKEHQKAGAKLVDFAGWEMPLHYGSQLEEHHQVRRAAGVFDVSHMGVVEIKGKEAVAYLRYLLANDIAKLTTSGKALYTCMLNEQGGVIDDLIVYKLADDAFRLVINAGTREKDLAWMRQQQAKFNNLDILERKDLAILAVQGPMAINTVSAVLQCPELLSLPSFHSLMHGEWLLAHTGYTGEEGLEIILPATEMVTFWQQLLATNVMPCGLAARDTLRLEAGLNLYGNDMGEETSPLESNLAWTIAWEPSERDFIGRTALMAQKKQGPKQKLVGLILDQPGVLRSHQKVIIPKDGIGEITSGSFSPCLNCGIALARVPITTQEEALVEIRGKQVPVRVVKPVFVRKGKAV